MFDSGRARVVAVCATPPHFNPGMLSVDLALDVVVRRHQLDVEIDRRVLYTPLELHRTGWGGSSNDYGLPSGYRSIRTEDAQLEQARAILFWGDFTHSRRHRGDVAQVLTRCGLVSTEQEAYALVDRHLFLSTQPAEVLARTILFGNCLLTEADHAQPDDLYERQLQRLLRGARDVWMRDALSARRAAELRNSTSQSHLGVDCALLLRPEDCASIAGATPDRSPRRAGVFFGRTHQDPALLLHFASKLCQKLQIEPNWLPWFSATALNPEVVRRCWPDLPIPQSAETLPFALNTLLRCDVVITDAYHLCVLAWNNGIPALCVGRGASGFTTSISDKKKELLFLTFGADRFYVFAEHLEAILTSEPKNDSVPQPFHLDVVPLSLDRLAEHLCNKQLVASIQKRIATQRDAAERQLIGSLRALLGERNAPRPRGLIFRTAKTVTPPFARALARRALTALAQVVHRPRGRSPFQ